MNNKLKNILIFIVTFSIIAIFSQYGRELGEILSNKIIKNEVILDKPWFRNSYYGFSFETPEKLYKLNTSIPVGYEEFINLSDTYVLEKGDLFVIFVYMDTNFEDYDTEVGLTGAIQNTVNTINGTSLELFFERPEGDFDELLGNGNFFVSEEEFMVKGYIYWNGEGKCVILATFITNSENNKEISNRIINSRRKAF